MYQARKPAVQIAKESNGIQPMNMVMADYKSALSIFSDETLTHVYNLILNDVDLDQKGNGTTNSYETNSGLQTKDQDGDDKAAVTDTGNNNELKNTNTTNHTELVKLHQKCKVATSKIAKIESSPGFLQSPLFTKNNNNPANRHNHPSLNNHTKLNTKQPSFNNLSIPRTQIRRHSSGGGSGLSFSSTNKNAYMQSSNMQHLKRSNSGFARQQQQQHHMNKTTAGSKDDKDYTYQSNENVTQGNIPASALSFLAALNSKKSNLSSAPTIIPSHANNKHGVSKKKGKKRIVVPATNKDNDDEMSIVVDDDQEESECDLYTSANQDDENEQRPHPKRSSIRNNHRPIQVKSRKRRHSNNDNSDDNQVGSPQQKKHKLDDGDRLRGRVDIVYDVGDLVAVYYEQDDQWYEATIIDITFKKYQQPSAELFSSSSSSSNNENTSQRAKRAQKRIIGGRKDDEEASKGREGGNQNEPELRVNYYTIEFDNGEIQEHVLPEDVMDRLNDSDDSDM